MRLLFILCFFIVGLIASHIRRYEKVSMQIGFISVHNQNIDGAVWTPDVYPINETAKLTHDYAAYLRN